MWFVGHKKARKVQVMLPVQSVEESLPMPTMWHRVVNTNNSSNAFSYNKVSIMAVIEQERRT
jgi:hypothetical protein